MLKLLHIGNGRSRYPQDGWFHRALAGIVETTIVPDGRDLSDGDRARMIRKADILLLIWGSMPIPGEITDDPGRLRYVINMSGELRSWVPLSLIEAGMLVTNWGDAPADQVAEGAMALLLAVMKNLRDRIDSVARGGWSIATRDTAGSLLGCDVGIYGLGAIGRRFVGLIRPFGPVLRVYDPYVEALPEGCLRADSLRDLFAASSIAVIHAGLSDETRGSVDRGMLALLPDGGIVINTARGGIVDQEALFAELKSGRLRAGLDVLDGKMGDTLEEDHPARAWNNLILTGHEVSGVSWGTERTNERVMQEIALDNIERFIAGRPVRFVMDRDRYLRST